MELSKLKTKVMKLKITYQERSQVLEGLKPFDKMIKEIIEAAEYFNDTIHRNDWLHIQYPIQDWLVAYHHPPSDSRIIRL